MLGDVAGMPSKLKLNAIIILGFTLVVLFMVALFGNDNGSNFFNAYVIGTPNTLTGGSNPDNVDVSLPTEEASQSTLTEEEKYLLVLNILKLKGLDKKTTRLQFAEKVSNVAKYIEQLGNKDVTEKWDSMNSCLEVGCGKPYYDLLMIVLDIAFNQKDEGNFITQIFNSDSKYSFIPDLMKNVIALENAVDSGEVIKTSKATTAVNTYIYKVDSAGVTDLWNALVNCDMKCNLYDNLLVELTLFRLDHINE
jgi:hypothetical protein